MATNFQQTDAAAGATNVQCSGNSQNTDKESNQAQFAGTAGSTPRTLTVNASAADLNGVWMEIINLNNYDGASGTWTWRINITTGNHQITLDEVHICHVDSSYAAKNTLGSAVGLGLNLGSTGVQSGNITQSSSVTVATGDMVIIIFAFDNANSMNQDIAYTPDSLIASPWTFVPPVNDPPPKASRSSDPSMGQFGPILGM